MSKAMTPNLLSRFLILSLILAGSVHANSTTWQLGSELLKEQRYELSAVEFRRFAMESRDPDAQAASYLHAGYAYLQDTAGRTAGDMLDRAENADTTQRYFKETTLLRAENARLMRDSGTASYFYDLLAMEPDAPAYQRFARRRAAVMQLNNRALEAARQQLIQSPADETSALKAIEAYEEGHDKSPKVGGLLGIIPGAGYWYSGEIANGFRSLILNSIFIFGMVHTAEEEQWGAFTAITFFEITWYSGSIYGGIDAAQRYNRDRLQAAINGIESDMRYAAEPVTTVPVFKLNIAF